MASSPLTGLDALTEGELARRRNEAWTFVRASRGDVSARNLVGLLSHAMQHRAINPSGVLVRPGGLDYRVRAEVMSTGPRASLVVSLVGGGGAEALAVEWTDDRTAAQVVADLDEELDYATDSPNLRLDATALFAGIIEAAQVGLEARFGEVPPDLMRVAAAPAPVDLWPVIEVVNRQWAVTVAGVESIERAWRIPMAQLEELTALEEAAAQPWVRLPELEAACEEAILVLPWFGFSGGQPEDPDA